MVRLDTSLPVWERVFTVSPLVVVGTREGDGYDLAPKHMAMPLGFEGYFGFVCTPAHGTYRNVQVEGAFTVSYPGPEQIVVTGLSAAPREGVGVEARRPGLDSLPTRPAEKVEGRVLRDALLVLECELERVIDGFGDDSLIVGRIVAARARADALRASEVDDEKVVRRAPLLAYLSPGRFTPISESRTFPFPAGFQR
jgi:flavin reductase (DIM6/NTAB) family NADH-FMN oxidoreductase RutF